MTTGVSLSAVATSSPEKRGKSWLRPGGGSAKGERKSLHANGRSPLALRLALPLPRLHAQSWCFGLSARRSFRFAGMDREKAPTYGSGWLSRNHLTDS